MHTPFFLLACLAGVFAFAFLSAGILSLQDEEPPKNWGDAVFHFIDGIVGGSSLVRGFEKNWSTHADARHLVYGGLVSLAAVVLFGYLAIQTS